MRMNELKYTKSELKLAVDLYFYDDFLYFCKHEEKEGRVTKACLSQWYPSLFVVDGIYCCPVKLENRQNSGVNY